MLYSVNNTDKINVSVHFNAGCRVSNGKEYLYCELAYQDKEQHRLFNRVCPASKFGKVCDLYHQINQGIYSTDEVKKQMEAL